MYSFLMGGSGWEPHHDTLLASRYYGARDSHLKAQFALVGGVAPPALLALPTLFMPEVDNQKEQIAHIGTVTSAKTYDGELHLEYVFDPSIRPISVAKIVDLAPQLDIETGGFSLTHTHWQVKNVDLFRVLLRSEATKAPAPTVFALDYEHRDPNLIGVMMPFDAAFNGVYAAIQTGATEAGFRCKRADDLWLHHQIMQTIVSLICQSGMVIADCTGRNPNVFYEAGIAHALGRDVILISQSMNDVPFDLRHLAVITYFPNTQGLQELADKLKERIPAVAERRRRA